MKKIKTTQDKVLKKRKRIRVGRRGKQKVTATEWVYIELIDNINDTFTIAPVTIGPRRKRRIKLLPQ